MHRSLVCFLDKFVRKLSISLVTLFLSIFIFFSFSCFFGVVQFGCLARDLATVCADIFWRRNNHSLIHDWSRAELIDITRHHSCFKRMSLLSYRNKELVFEPIFHDLIFFLFPCFLIFGLMGISSIVAASRQREGERKEERCSNSG